MERRYKNFVYEPTIQYFDPDWQKENCYCACKTQNCPVHTK